MTVMLGSHFNASYGFDLFRQFAWAGQLGHQMQAGGIGRSGLSSIADCFGGFGHQTIGSWNIQSTVGYAAMPDLANSGWLGVDKQKGVIQTPGGYEVKVGNGQVQIKAPNGKFTNLKAEPPERTVKGKETRTLPFLPRDPAVRESDGDVWRYQGAGSFMLPDGTKITINEQGEGKDLHISDVDVYNGNQHVHVDSQLTRSNWKTYKTEFGRWRNVGWRRQERDKTEYQRADQKFQTTFSDVRRDGFLHDLKTDDGKRFYAAGDGDDWAQNGREVISGAGKGKDDKTKPYQLGEAIDASWLGYRPLHVPWKGYLFGMTSISQSLFQSGWGTYGGHVGNLYGQMATMQGAPHLGAPCTIANMGGFDTMFGGPMAAAYYGTGFTGGFDASATFHQMLGSVRQMLPLFDRADLLAGALSSTRSWTHANMLM